MPEVISRVKMRASLFYFPVARWLRFLTLVEFDWSPLDGLKWPEMEHTWDNQKAIKRHSRRGVNEEISCRRDIRLWKIFYYFCFILFFCFVSRPFAFFLFPSSSAARFSSVIKSRYDRKRRSIQLRGQPSASFEWTRSGTSFPSAGWILDEFFSPFLFFFFFSFFR